MSISDSDASSPDSAHASSGDDASSSEIDTYPPKTNMGTNNLTLVAYREDISTLTKTSSRFLNIPALGTRYLLPSDQI